MKSAREFVEATAICNVTPRETCGACARWTTAIEARDKEHAAALARERETALEDAARRLHRLECLVRSPTDATWIKLYDALAALTALRSPPIDGTPGEGR